jgi:hypothetical protein
VSSKIHLRWPTWQMQSETPLFEKICYGPPLASRKISVAPCLLGADAPLAAASTSFAPHAPEIWRPLQRQLLLLPSGEPSP